MEGSLLARKLDALMGMGTGASADLINGVDHQERMRWLDIFSFLTPRKTMTRSSGCVNAWNCRVNCWWVDSRELTGGDDLNARIEHNIRTARHFLVVISIDALSSEWVQREVRLAQEIAQQTEGYKVISVVLPGVQPGILKPFFPREPVHIFVADTPTGLSDAMPNLFAALGMQLPMDWEPAQAVEAEPVEELILQLTDPRITETNGVRRAEATAELVYNPAGNSRAITSRRYTVKAPLGPIELEEIRW